MKYYIKSDSNNALVSSNYFVLSHRGVQYPHGYNLGMKPQDDYGSNFVKDVKFHNRFTVVIYLPYIANFEGSNKLTICKYTKKGFI